MLSTALVVLPIVCLAWLLSVVCGAWVLVCSSLEAAAFARAVFVEDERRAEGASAVSVLNRENRGEGAYIQG